MSNGVPPAQIETKQLLRALIRSFKFAVSMLEKVLRGEAV
jgi:hypothetical protein